MGRAHARAARAEDYLNVQKRGRPDLQVVEGGAERAFAAPPGREGPRSLRPDWLPEDLALPHELEPRRRAAPADREGIAGPERREQAAVGPEPAAVRPEPAPPERRRTLVLTGRPHDPVLEVRGERRRRTVTAARLAGRPDRVAGWAVLLGVVMALMAGATAGSEPKTAGAAAPQAPAAGR